MDRWLVAPMLIGSISLRRRVRLVRNRPAAEEDPGGGGDDEGHAGEGDGGKLLTMQDDLEEHGDRGLGQADDGDARG